MALDIYFTTFTGRTLYATLQRDSDSYYWSEAAGAWQSAPTFVNKRITLTEGASEFAGSYTGANTGNLGNAGITIVRIHDAGSANQTIAESQTYILSGSEVVNPSTPIPSYAATSPLSAGSITYQDVLEHLRDASSGATIVLESARDARRAVINGYAELVNLRDWSYQFVPLRIATVAPYSTGSITYTQSTNTLLLTGGTWPTWAALGSVLISSVLYRVLARVTSTTLTLDTSFAPAADIAAGTTYSIFQDTYPLPTDFKRMARPLPESSNFMSLYVSPQEFLELRRFSQSSGTAVAWTIVQNPLRGFQTGEFAVCFFPGPDAAITYDAIYQKTARALRRSGYATTDRAGTISGTISGSTITGVSTSFSSDMIGSILRIGTTAAYPEGLTGTTPYAEQFIVTDVASATSLTIGGTLAATYAAVKYAITDPIDVSQSMQNALLACCTKHLANLRRQDIPQATSAFYEQLKIAKASDSRFEGPRSAWDYQPGLPRRIAKWPSGADV